LITSIANDPPQLRSPDPGPETEIFDCPICGKQWLGDVGSFPVCEVCRSEVTIRELVLKKDKSERQDDIPETEPKSIHSRKLRWRKKCLHK
jgi:hypothetical protein